MTTQRAPMGRLLTAVTCALLAALSAGCVVVPYSPPTESQSTPVRLENAEQVVLSIGPREMLEETQASLRRRDRELEIVDSLAFRNAVFPEGGWRLSQLLAPAARLRLAASGADYLVVVGPVQVQDDGGHGLFLEVPGFGFYGAASGSTQGSALVLIVDLAHGEVLDAVATRARGTDVAVGFFYGLIVHATTETSVRNACLDSVVETVRAARPDGVVRLALMAAEPVESSNYALSVITE